MTWVAVTNTVRQICSYYTYISMRTCFTAVVDGGDVRPEFQLTTQSSFFFRYSYNGTPHTFSTKPYSIAETFRAQSLSTLGDSTLRLLFLCENCIAVGSDYMYKWMPVPEQCTRGTRNFLFACEQRAWGLDEEGINGIVTMGYGTFLSLSAFSQFAVCTAKWQAARADQTIQVVNAFLNGFHSDLWHLVFISFCAISI